MLAEKFDRIRGYMGLERNILVICIFFFILTTGNFLWLSLLPIYLDSIGLAAAWIGALIMGYTASASFTYLPSGRLSDMIGRRIPLIVGSCIMTLSTFLLSTSKNLLAITVFLISFGVGMGLMMPAANALIGESIEPARFGMAYASYNIFTLAATVLGSALSGVAAHTFGFQNVFLISAFLSFISLSIAYFLINETATDRSSSYSFAFKQSVKTSFSGTVSLLKNNRELSWITLALSIHTFGFYMLYPYIALYAQYGANLNIVQAGLIISLWNVGLLLGQIPSGKMTDNLGSRLTLFLHFLLSIVTWILYTLSTSFFLAATTIIFFGIVGAMDMPARRTLMIEYSSSKTGKATVIGSLDSIIGVASLLAPLAGGIVWSKIGYSAPFIVGAMINAFGCIPLLKLLEGRSRNTG